MAARKWAHSGRCPMADVLPCPRSLTKKASVLMFTGKSGALAAVLSASHLLTPAQFAHVWVSRHAQVLDARVAARAVIHPCQHVARGGLVAVARSLAAKHKTILVVDHADRARADARRLQRAGVTSAFVLEGGARAYRVIMRFGTY